MAVVTISGPAALGIRGRVAFAVAGLILFAATIVGSAVVLSFTRDLMRPWWLLAQSLVAGVTVSAWLLIRRPSRPTFRRPFHPEFVRKIRAHPVTAVLIAIVLTSLGLEFFLAVAVAPNNVDSIGYHLTRADYWLQYKSVFQFPGGTTKQLYYPANGEVVQAWTLAISGSDRFAQLVQWASAIGCALCVYLGAALLGFRRAHAVFAAGVFLVLPIVVLESTTTQNDLIAAFFVAATLVFAARAIAGRSYGDLIVAALALGLAVGTKGTALLALPSLLILVGAAVWRYRPPRSLAFVGVACAALAVIGLGSFNYVQSWARTGSPFGNALHLTDRREPLVPNGIRSAWTFVDLPGMHADWLDSAIQRPARAVFGDLEQADFDFTVDTKVQEDDAAFGPVGLLFLLPMVVITCVWPRVAWRRRLVAFSALLFLGLFFASINYNPWLGRLLIVFVVLAAPLMAVFARHSVLRALVVVAALIALVPVLFANEQKPLIASDGQGNILSRDRLSQQLITWPEMKRVVDFVDRHVPAGSTLGYVGGAEADPKCGCCWDYPFFGAHRERRILRFTDPKRITYNLMRTERMRGALFECVGRPPLPLRATRLGPGDHFWFVELDT
jgi:4-amino-4-deoxy-L-arabinose transferase-like glycosyltransferase